MIFTYLLIWYACSLVSLGLHCKSSYSLSVCGLFLIVGTGPFGMVVNLMDYFRDKHCPIIWNKYDRA